MTRCPACPGIQELRVRKERREIEVIQDSPERLVFPDLLDLMGRKERKGSPGFLDHLDDKDFQEMLEILEKKDVKASATAETQALLGSQAPLDSRALQETPLWGLMDQSAFQDHQGHRDPKESPVLQGLMDCKGFLV